MSGFNKNSNETKLGKWVEEEMIDAFTARGHTLLIDYSDTYLKYPDQAWHLKGGDTKVYLECKGFSQPDLWRMTGKYQIGLREPQLYRYLNLLNDNPNENIFYACWIGKYRNEIGKTYIIPINKLAGKADHSSDDFDKSKKIDKSLFYDMDYIQSESVSVLDIPLSEGMGFKSYVKTGDTRHPKEQVIFKTGSN